MTLSDDYASDAGTTGILATGGQASGHFEAPGDQDWFKVALTAGNYYTFNLYAPAYNYLDTAHGTPGVYPVAASGGFLFPVASGGGASGNNITIKVETSGDYYLAADNPGVYTENLAYTLRNSATVADDAGDTYASARTISLGEQVNGRFEFRVDADQYKVALVAGHVYTVSAGWNGTDLSPTLYATGFSLQGPAGTVISSEASASGHSHTFVAAASGDYYLGASSISRGISPVGGYEAAGDYQLSIAAAARLQTGAGTGAALSGYQGGADTAVYALARGGYVLARGADGAATVQLSGAAKGDTLSHIERLRFQDASVALDVDGAGGQAYRLYQAALHRAPDKEGLGYWMQQLDQGARLASVADAFITSAEFQHLYGAAASDAEFVGQLYANTLHRTPDQAGLDFWVSGLRNGASRAEVLTGFSESAENQAAALALIGNGFEYTPYG